MPVTSLYAALLAALYLFLSFRVIGVRRGRRVDMGDADDPLLRRYIRAHGNFAEYAPLGLLLLLLAELGGWPRPLVHGLGLMLLVGRAAHAWSFSVAELREPSRVVGMVLTLAMLGLAAALCLARWVGLA
jgi:uncharacterized membrane protein YecN with MAPEG domain